MSLRRTECASRGLTPALALLLLSALWAMAALLPDLLPRFRAEALSPALGQAVLFAVFAGIAATVSSARGLPFPRGSRAWICAVVGVGLFVVPTLLATAVQGWISSFDRVAVFSLTPVFAIILEPHLQDNAPPHGNAALLAALAAFAGILCIFPLDVPGSFIAGAALCALIAAAVGVGAANCLAVKVARDLDGPSILPMAAQASAASAVCFAAAAALTPHSALDWSAFPSRLLPMVLLDIPSLFLLFWLMRRISASRMTARFLLAPLFTLLGGIAVEQTMPPARALVGMALLAAGATWLAFGPGEDESN